MKMLTVQQPWADAIMRDRRRKDIENRVWDTTHTGTLGIHSGARVDRRASIDTDIDEQRLRGFVLGTVELVGTHEAGSAECRARRCITNPWAHWPYNPEQPESGSNRRDIRQLWHWEFEQPRRFVTPIPAKGMLKLWESGPSLEHLISIADIETRPSALVFYRGVSS